MWKKDKYHQKLNSLNPAWCLLPPPAKVPAAAGGNTLRNNFNTSPSPSTPLVSTYRPTKKTTPRRPPRDGPKASIAAEPTSPRIGCMGQIRRCKPPSGGGAVSGLWRSKTSSSSFKSTAASPPPANGSGKGRLDNMMRVDTVEGMDPPRPVERKKEEVGDRSSTSLWKRRCGAGGGGGGLRLPEPVREVGLS